MKIEWCIHCVSYCFSQNMLYLKRKKKLAMKEFGSIEMWSKAHIKYLLGFNLIVLFSVTVHFCEPHFTFIWPFITLHVCNIRNMKQTSYTAKQIAFEIKWHKFVLDIGSKRKKTYNRTVARRKCMLVMASIKSHFTLRRWF